MSDQKHIALVIGSMRTGGAERAFINLANALVNLNCRVDLVLVERTGNFLPLADPRIRIVDLNAKQTRKAGKAFQNYLLDENPQAVIVAQTHVQLMVCMSILRLQWNGKLILNEQSTFSQNNKGFKKFIQYILARFYFRRADAVTVVSSGAADDFLSHFSFLRNRTSVVFNPIITEQSAALVQENIDHLFFGENVPVFIAAGRLVKSKNFEMLIRAFATAKKSIDARLIILGEGPERIFLENLISELKLASYVSLPGESSNTLGYFAKAGFVVLSSDYEGLPAVLIEALYWNCKIISTNCPYGPSEILEEGKFGKLVPVRDTEALSDALISISQQRGEQDGRIRAKDFFADTIALEYLRLLDK